MREFKPAYPYSTAIELLIPTYATQKGVVTKTFPVTGIQLFASFKTYTGTETNTNEVFTVVDTAIVETWYRPDVKADCRIKVLQTGDVYEILGKPENINMRNQFLKFKVQAVEGGA
ncbi:MAG: head-tail adaptor protein [Lachnospiraceae bacterium]|nr:head-tail adaptor protein [Lachnospiraceae bacterium]